jgi:hypothetical protein
VKRIRSRSGYAQSAVNELDLRRDEWRMWQSWPGRAEGPPFLTEEGKPFSLPGFKNYLARLGDRFKAAGIENWMAHRSGHYRATSAHHAGMSVFDIAAEGGRRAISRWSSRTRRTDRSRSCSDSRRRCRSCFESELLKSQVSGESGELPRNQVKHRDWRKHRVRSIRHGSLLGRVDSNHRLPDPESGALPLGHSPRSTRIIPEARSASKAAGSRSG